MSAIKHFELVKDIEHDTQYAAEQMRDDPCFETFQVFKSYHPTRKLYEYNFYFKMKNKDGSTTGSMRCDFQVTEAKMETLRWDEFIDTIYGSCFYGILYLMQIGHLKMTNVLIGDRKTNDS